jgi:hypothetical protein
VSKAIACVPDPEHRVFAVDGFRMGTLRRTPVNDMISNDVRMEENELYEFVRDLYKLTPDELLLMCAYGPFIPSLFYVSHPLSPLQRACCGDRLLKVTIRCEWANQRELEEGFGGRAGQERRAGV